MHADFQREIDALNAMTVDQLRERYTAAFGDQTRVGSPAWLIRRIAWRMQAMAEGDLSIRARRRAEELANEADLRLSPPRTVDPKEAGDSRIESGGRSKRDRRLPPVGATITP